MRVHSFLMAKPDSHPPHSGQRIPAGSPANASPQSTRGEVCHRRRIPGCRARCEETISALESATSRRASAERAFNAACQARSLDPMIRLLRCLPPIRLVCIALRVRIQEIDWAVNDARGAILNAAE